MIITFKCPDALNDTVADYLRDIEDELRQSDKTFDDKEAELWEAEQYIKSALALYIEHGEYIKIDFDLKNQTAKVVRVK